MGLSDAQAVSWLGAGPALSATAPASVDTAEMISALVEEYSATLYRVAYSVCRNSAEAEDAVQETFLRVLRHQDQLGEIRDLRVWLVRITWNVVLDRKRRAKVRPETEDIADLAHVLPAAGLKADDTGDCSPGTYACALACRPATQEGTRGSAAFGVRRTFDSPDCRRSRHHGLFCALATLPGAPSALRHAGERRPMILPFATRRESQPEAQAQIDRTLHLLQNVRGSRQAE